MKKTENICIFWYRRDLRLDDNAGLYEALKNEKNILPIFIFDQDILVHLKDKTDQRVVFIFDTISEMKKEFQAKGSELKVFHGKPLEIFEKIFKEHNVTSVYTNHDYEPRARKRDDAVEKFCAKNKIEFKTFKDQVIFEKDEILTEQKNHYTVYTPYKNRWLKSLSKFYLESYPTKKYFKNLAKITPSKMPTLKELGFERVPFEYFPAAHVKKDLLKNYDKDRDFPALDATSHLGLHLRFGTLSIRELAREGQKLNSVWLSELIWREFFMQILWHHPEVEKRSFREKYEAVEWRTNTKEFQKWCDGQTGYPLVDAGMRELNTTGFMHNRVRMVTASFLCKHLLMYWYIGERYFAEKLLDYDVSANNGNWQWAAGTGCDAAPYFRVFNPEAQMKRFDPDMKYIKKWVPELGTDKYPEPMVEHKFARERVLAAFAKALKG